MDSAPKWLIVATLPSGKKTYAPWAFDEYEHAAEFAEKIVNILPEGSYTEVEQQVKPNA